MSSSDTNGHSLSTAATPQRMPRVGEIVHYVPAGKDEERNAPFHPAIVTRVWGPSCVNLRVIPDEGDSFRKTSCSKGSMSDSAEPKPSRGCWYWPA